MRFFRILILYILICPIGSGIITTAQDLQSHNQIVQSVEKQNQQLPAFDRHIYDLLESSTFHEPYYPPFQISQIRFDEKASFNIAPSGLTKSLGGLAEVFLKEKGTLENAFLLYQNQDYVKAEEKLLSILPSTSELGDKATLLLAWTKFKRLQLDAALAYAKAGFVAKHPSTALESFYLASLILWKSQAWQQIIEIYQQHSSTREASFWDARVSLMQAVALLSLRRWTATSDFIEKSDLHRFAHARYFHKFYEISGIAYFKQKEYAKSLENTLQAQKLNPDLTYRKRLNRTVAWQYYFLDQYSYSLDLIHKSLPFSLIDDSDETKYLRLACLIKLNRWQQVEKHLSGIRTSSIFYKYAVFLIQTHAGLAKTNPKLLKSIQDVRYDFPEMVFKSSLKKGNLYFQNKQFPKAERNYLQALSADLNSSEYHLAQYNLGLTHLKLKEYEKARRGFVELLHTLAPQNHPRVRYHLLYSLYGLNRGSDYLRELKNVPLNKLSKKRRHELKFMQGNILANKGEHSKASKVFFELWKQAGDISAFEAGITALYHDQKYNTVLSLLNRKSSPRTADLKDFKIRSLLKNNQPQQALRTLNQTAFKIEEKTDLVLEVWMANQLYTKVISQANGMLGRSLTSQKRFLLYLGLGEAHYRVKQFTASKNQFHKALKTASTPTQVNAIQYNIALIAYYSKNYQSFTREADAILAKKNLSHEIRYSLTELLVNYYQHQQEVEKADSILVAYISNHSFKRPRAKLKRIALHYDNQYYSRCYELADVVDRAESSYQHRDRLLLFGYCGNQINKEEEVIQKLQQELSIKTNTYRQKEMEFVLAQSYFMQGNYIESHQRSTILISQKLNKKIKENTQVLLVNNLVKLKEFDTADAELGDPNRFRHSDLYPETLKLRAEIDFIKGRPDSSIKSLLRHYYLPDTSEDEKLDNLIRVCEILVEFKRISEAQKYWERIDEKRISQDPQTNERYQLLARSLRRPES